LHTNIKLKADILKMPFGASRKLKKSGNEANVASSASPTKKIGPSTKPKKTENISDFETIGQSVCGPRLGGGRSNPTKESSAEVAYKKLLPSSEAYATRPRINRSSGTFYPILTSYFVEQTAILSEQNIIFDIFGNFYTTKKIYKGNALKIPANYTPFFDTKAFLQYDFFEDLKTGSATSDIEKNSISYFLRFCRTETTGPTKIMVKDEAVEFESSSGVQIKQGHFFLKNLDADRKLIALEDLDAGVLLRGFPGKNQNFVYYNEDLMLQSGESSGSYTYYKKYSED